MYSHIQLPLRRQSEYYTFRPYIILVSQLRLLYWIIYHPNVSISFVIATCLLPWTINYLTWQHRYLFRPTPQLHKPFYPLPGIGHRWFLFFPKFTQFHYLPWIIFILLWLDYPLRVLFVIWSIYITQHPLHPLGLHHLPHYLFVQPQQQLHWRHATIIYLFLFYTHPLAFRS
jgi:hypothetical protein